MALATIDPLDKITRFAGDRFHEIPDIIEFVTSPHWLNRPMLYPRQATLLKVIFLQTEIMTQYDYDVIGEWTEGFRLPSMATPVGFDPDSEVVRHFEGDWGIVPDVLERIEYLRNSGYHWFRLVLSVLGRRASKGYIGGLCGAYVLWRFLAAEDPRAYYGIDPEKRIVCQVFASKKGQARDNQWRDLNNVIFNAPCFQPFISLSLTEYLSIFSRRDLMRPQRKTTMDLATFEIVPKEATTNAARGPASFMQYYDEMAHMIQTTGGSDSAHDVYEAATPALDQFRKDGFIYSGSSPWTMTGHFYTLCQQTLEVEADTGRPVYPENLLLQLASWDIYEDWERTLTAFPARPATTIAVTTPVGVEGRSVPQIVFHPLRGAIQEYDDRMRRLERANPDTFRVERRSKWATALDAYFPEHHVRRMFAPWPGEHRLPMRLQGSPTIDYVMHGDPGETGSNFGFAIAHKEHVEGQALAHVVIDFVKAWQPSDFPNEYSERRVAADPTTAIPAGEMDYTAIEDEIKDYIDNFLPIDVSLDPWNAIGILQRLGAWSRRNFKVAQVWQRNVTASLNWRTAETMKTALSLNLVHAPVYELLELECLFLRKLPGDKVDHQNTGPCTTKDVYDAVSICVHKLIGDDVAMYMGEQFSELRGSVGLPGPNSEVMAGGGESNDVLGRFSQLTAMSNAARGGRGMPRR